MTVAANIYLGFAEGPAMILTRGCPMIIAGVFVLGIPGLLVSGGANFATLMYMLPSKPTGEDIAGLYAAHPELYRGVCITILAWNVMFCLVAYMLEQSVQIRLMDESEHKNLFLAKMSHEMRTPLVGIFGVWDILLSSLSSESASFVKQVSPVMQSCLNNLKRLIDDILDVSKLSKGLIQVELATADLHDIIKPVIELFKPVADLKNVNLHFVTSIPEPFFIETDKVRLAQIILNFVANAIKFTDAGEIKIAAELMESNLSESPTDDVRLIRIAVEDSGIGLKPGDKDRLFRLFEQGSDQKRGGTGLGLAIAKELTSLLGGTITAKSRAMGHGSIFEVIVPCRIASAPEVAPTHPIDKISSQSKARILLAEDNQVSQFVFRRMLENAGYSVQIVPDGAAALEALRATHHLPDDDPEQFKILLLDLEMPIMTGWEVLERMEKEHIKLPTVVLTAHALNPTAQSSILKYADDVGTKPLSLPKLQELIQKYSR